MITSNKCHHIHGDTDGVGVEPLQRRKKNYSHPRNMANLITGLNLSEFFVDSKL